MKKITITIEAKLPSFDWNLLMGSVGFWNQEGQGVYDGNIAKTLGSRESQLAAKSEGFDMFILNNLAMDVAKGLPEGYKSGRAGSHVWVSRPDNERVIIMKFDAPEGSVVIPNPITDEQRENLLCCALEGGSNYWYLLAKDAMAMIRNPATYVKGEPLVSNMWRAIKAGAVIPVNDAEEPAEVLGHISLESIAAAEQIMAKDYVRHFTDIMNENEDADTGDVWFQLATLNGVLTFG